MQVHVLASGSTGNATYVQMGQTQLLIDAGISARRIDKSLKELGTDLKTIDAIVVTHEHQDHIKGLSTLTRRYGLTVYGRPRTLEALSCRKELPPEAVRPLNDRLEIGEMVIEPFPTFHDAADPVGFCVYGEGKKCSFVTDLGFATDSVKSAIAYSDVLILETNHDVDMLKNGSYPWHLKRRILSNRGHLSNNDAGWLLARLPMKEKTHVFLAHMSQENNCPDLAEKTVSTILESQGLRDSFELYLTYPDAISSLT